jgi:hypothetical protein
MAWSGSASSFMGQLLVRDKHKNAPKAQQQMF